MAGFIHQSTPARVAAFVLMSCGACDCIGEGSVGAGRAPAAPPVATTPRFDTLPLLEEYVGEEVAGGHFETAVQYLDVGARERFRVHAERGLLVDGAGRPLDPALEQYPGRDGLAIFVMDAAGNLYASFDASRGYFHHSSFLAGGPVAAAGDFVISAGRLRAVTNASGHYRPPAVTLERVRARLLEMGVDLSAAEFTPVRGSLP
jgi:hypothetical protein